jgi:transposase
MSHIYKKRWEVIFLIKHDYGPHMSVQAAAKYLGESRGWVYNVLKQYEQFGNVDFSNNRGRKRSTTEKQDQEIVKLAVSEKPMTSVQIAQTMAKKGAMVSHDTVTRRLNENKCQYRAVLKKPLLKICHIERRLTWAHEHLDRNWTRVIFSDESTFELPYGATRAWQVRGNPKVIPAVAHPPKVNVWGCFSSRGFGKLVLIHGILKSDQMVKVYERGLLPSAEKFFGAGNQNWHLLEDMDPKHTSKLCTAWKAQHGVKVIKWPAYSPDCNPIENVWGLIKARNRKKK